jgi:hypothetical protein
VYEQHLARRNLSLREGHDRQRWRARQLELTVRHRADREQQPRRRIVDVGRAELRRRQLNAGTLCERQCVLCDHGRIIDRSHVDCHRVGSGR